ALSWREPDIPPAPSARNSMDQPLEPMRLTRLLWCAVVVVLILVTASSTANFLWSRTPPNQPTAKLWSGPGGWLAMEDPDHDWAPNLKAIESETSETFTMGPREASLYLASYPMTRRGVELVHSSNAVRASGEW